MFDTVNLVSEHKHSKALCLTVSLHNRVLIFNLLTNSFSMCTEGIVLPAYCTL